jgi:pimeloyl-ACP methyl ester carboxylesterase
VKFLSVLFFSFLAHISFPQLSITMVQASSQDWDKGEKSGLVSVGNHKLYVSVAGPDRKKDEPVIVLMQGLGATITEWVVVRRLVTPFARFLCYDRSGMGKSECYPEAPEAITAVAIAHELNTLLKNINVAPPYIVVCHSWGGILAREFLHLRKEVVGMVFVDANQETTFERPEDFPYPCFMAIQDGIDEWEMTGERENHVLSKEEFELIEKSNEDPRHQATQMTELGGFKTCFPVLAAKKQLENHALGNHPVSVIHGRYTGQHFQNTYDAAIARGNGTEKDREEFRYLIKEWEENSGPRMKKILDLSTDASLGVYRETERSGHNVQLTEPELIVEEIKRVYDYEVKRLRS